MRKEAAYPYMNVLLRLEITMTTVTPVLRRRYYRFIRPTRSERHLLHLRRRGARSEELQLRCPRNENCKKMSGLPRILSSTMRSRCHAPRLFSSLQLVDSVCDSAGLKSMQWISRVKFATQVGVREAMVADEDSVLVRDFIDSALYDEKQGYFAARSIAVGELPAPINFSALEGQRAYTQYLDNLYKRADSSWFTPVELFQPYYGFALAKFILQTHGSANPLRIYEIGGGTGTCARNILDYIKAHAPRSLYETMTYTSVEISGELAKKQYEKVVTGEINRKQFSVERRNATDRSGWETVKMEPCFIIMLEVLDNLPHDLVYRETSRSPWLEKRIVERSVGEVLRSPVEILSPLQDELIICCLEAMKRGLGENSSIMGSLKNVVVKLLNASELIWVPTGCMKLLETLHSARPNMTLIASDFSSLPDVKIAGEGAPLVSSKKGGVNKDHTSYLEAKGHADIFFPTDFSVLQKLDHYCSAANGVSRASRRSSIVNSGQFMDLFADTGKTLTRDGYNPLLEDFSNTKIYISTPLGGSGPS